MILILKKPFWRGTKDRGNSIYIADGSITERKSANTSNHYTVIIDEALRLDDSNHPLYAPITIIKLMQKIMVNYLQLFHLMKQKLVLLAVMIYGIQKL